jgi:hypothetical protein
MSLELDPILDLIISPLDADVTAEGVPDAVGQLFENARLDSAVGQAGTAASLQRETAHFDRTASDILKRDRSTAPPAESEVPNDSRDYILLQKSWRPEKPAKIVKSPNGLYLYHLDGNGNMIRAVAVDDAA